MSASSLKELLISLKAILISLNAFDWLLIVIVGFSMLLSFRRGLVRAIFSLLGFVGGFELAGWTYRWVGDWISQYRLTPTQAAARVIGFLLVVVLVAAVFELLGWLIQRMLKAVGFSPLDRVLGAGFGFARGCLVGIALLMGVTFFAPQSVAVSTSVLSPYLFAVAHDVSFLVPQYFQGLMEAGAFDVHGNSPHWINRH